MKYYCYVYYDENWQAYYVGKFCTKGDIPVEYSIAFGEWEAW